MWPTSAPTGVLATSTHMIPPASPLPPTPGWRKEEEEEETALCGNGA